jgi:hypothetical protein
LAYESGMNPVSAAYPDDVEATIFYALALAAAADPADKTYAKQLKAGAILESLFVQYPNHPGLAHYIIHAYDVPPLAARALGAARRYSEIAPGSPHALHMPSHTFTRVGDWQSSIDANIASAAAARRDGQTGEELHASDYMVYAYLQTAQDSAAQHVVETAVQIFSRFDPAVLPTRRFRLVTVWNGAPGPMRQGSRRTPARFRTQMRSPTLREAWEPRIQKIVPLRARQSTP